MVTLLHTATSTVTAVTSANLTIPATTAGSFLVLYCGSDDVAPTNAATLATSGKAFTLHVDPLNGSSYQSFLWLANAPAGETTIHITMTFSASNAFGYLEFSGITDGTRDLFGWYAGAVDPGPADFTKTVTGGSMTTSDELYIGAINVSAVATETFSSPTNGVGTQGGAPAIGVSNSSLLGEQICVVWEETTTQVSNGNVHMGISWSSTSDSLKGTDGMGLLFRVTPITTGFFSSVNHPSPRT